MNAVFYCGLLRGDQHTTRLKMNFVHILAALAHSGYFDAYLYYPLNIFNNDTSC
jgi:hypothetical protein